MQPPQRRTIACREIMLLNFELHKCLSTLTRAETRLPVNNGGRVQWRSTSPLDLPNGACVYRNQIAVSSNRGICNCVAGEFAQ